MESKNSEQRYTTKIKHVVEEDVKLILQNSGHLNKDTVLVDFVVYNASDKMLGFLADYWKIKIVISDNNGSRKTLSFFIKAVSKTNAAKANMAKDLNFFTKELSIYSIPLDNPGVKPWRAKFIAAFNEMIVFQDLNALQYKLRNKFDTFDMAHTLQALRTLASFHASSIIFEENKKRELQKPYKLTDEYEELLDVGSYTSSDVWFTQCKLAALEAIKAFSEYSKDNHTMSMIESRWDDVYEKALKLAQPSTKVRNVIGHRDLWNNNLLFHYKKVGDELEPDDCVFVDFQACAYQPLTGDIMMLLYCNLDPKLREDNMSMFLNYYHQELRQIVCNFGICIDDILSKEDFFSSAEEQRLWGNVTWANLIQLVWVEEDLVTSIFSDSSKYLEIFTKDKATFVKKMMCSNHSYKVKVLAMFEELVERFCI